MANTTIVLKGPRLPDQGGDTFVSTARPWADHPTITLGNVPSAYANHQLLRTISLYINFDLDFSFTTSATTIYYCHATLNDHDTYKPPWLDGTWTDTGDSFVILVPDALTAAGFKNCTVKIYSKGNSGVFTYPGFQYDDWDSRLSYYVGFFLFPTAASVTGIYPENFELISDISAAYTAPARDEYMWTESTVADHAGWNYSSEAVNSFSDMDAAMSALSGTGGLVVFDDGNYNALGSETISGVHGTAANPIRVRPQTPGGAVFTGHCELDFSSCSYIIFEGFWWAGFTSSSNFESVINIHDDSKWVWIRNCKFSNIDGLAGKPGAHVIEDNGSYNGHNNCDFDDHRDELQTYIVIPDGDGDTNTRFMRAHHNHYYNRRTADSTTGTGFSKQPQDGQLGNDGYFNTHFAGIYDHNLSIRWKRPPEGEVVGVKGVKWALANNVYDDCFGRQALRTCADILSIANRFYNRGDGEPMNIISMNGSPEGGTIGRSDIISSLNYFEDFDYVNGCWELLRIAEGLGSAGKRWVVNRVLLVRDMVPTALDEMIKTSTVSGSGTLHKAKNVRFVACSGQRTNSSGTPTSDPVFHFSNHSPDATVTYSGSVFGGTGTAPSGVTIVPSSSGAFFVDRGDGIKIPSHASLTDDQNVCFPTRLEGGSLTVGVTW